MEPDWLKSLVELMGLTRDPPTVLPLAVLVDEVDRWRRHARDESWKRKANRVSLSRDLEAGVAGAGTRLAQFVASDLRLYQECLEHLAALTQVAAGSRRELAVTGAALRTALATPGAMRAAWQDVLAASQSPEADTESLSWALTWLEAMIDSTQRSPEQTLRDVRAILDPDPRFARFNPGAPAGRTPLETRLGLAADMVAEPPAPHRCIAWITYGSAQLSGPVRDFGPITFYEIDWVLPNALDADGQPFRHRDELRSLLEQDATNPPDYSRGRPYQVLARVDLGVRPPYNALDDADAMIQVLLKIASNRSAGAAWQRAGSAYLLADGRLALAVHSAGPHIDDEVDHVGQDAMAEALGEYGPAIAKALGRTPMPPDLADALRLLSEASDVDSREAVLTGRSTIDRKTVIILEDAAFGHIASYGRTSDDDLEESILMAWPQALWIRQVRAAINVCLRSNEVASATLYRQIITHQRGRTRTSLVEASRLSSELLALCRDPLKRRFAEKWLASIGDAALCLHLHRQLEGERDLLQQRLSRTRNALVHGNPVHPVVIATVRDLSHYRANSAFTLALEVFSGSSSFDAALRARTDEYKRRVHHLSQGVSMFDNWQAVR